MSKELLRWTHACVAERQIRLDWFNNIMVDLSLDSWPRNGRHHLRWSGTSTCNKKLEVLIEVLTCLHSVGVIKTGGVRRTLPPAEGLPDLDLPLGIDRSHMMLTSSHRLYYPLQRYGWQISLDLHSSRSCSCNYSNIEQGSAAGRGPMLEHNHLCNI